jgi:hypothetical protein
MLAPSLRLTQAFFLRNESGVRAPGLGAACLPNTQLGFSALVFLAADKILKKLLELLLQTVGFLLQRVKDGDPFNFRVLSAKQDELDLDHNGWGDKCVERGTKFAKSCPAKGANGSGRWTG